MDLGITSAHHAVVIDETCRVVARSRAHPTVDSLGALERLALEGAPEDTELEVVIDPTGAAWLPVAVFFIRRGHRVFRPDVSQTAHLRRALARRAKTNRVDAEVLAKLAVWNRGALHELELPAGRAAELDRLVRATERLTEEIARHKGRIRDLARTAMPLVGQAISKTMGRADLEVLRSYGDPRELLELGLEGLTGLISEVSRGEHGRAKARAYLRAAQEAVELYGDSGAVAFEVIAEELAAEITRLEVAEATLRPLERRREETYRAVDPTGLARSLPGMARVGAPLGVAFTGRPARFPSGDRYASYVGLVPGSRETGETDRKGQPMTKAGNRKLRRMFVRAADTARKLDPQLARIYYVQMVERGAHHNKAVAVVAAHLARRFWATMVRGTPYVIRDVDGRPVDRAEAKAIVAARYTVPEEVRARRRSKKKRRAVPHQVLVGHVFDAGPRRAADPRRPSPAPPMMRRREEVVKASS
jgi:transposase